VIVRNLGNVDVASVEVTVTAEAGVFTDATISDGLSELALQSNAFATFAHDIRTVRLTSFAPGEFDSFAFSGTVSTGAQNRSSIGLLAEAANPADDFLESVGVVYIDKLLEEAAVRGFPIEDLEPEAANAAFAAIDEWLEASGEILSIGVIERRRSSFGRVSALGISGSRNFDPPRQTCDFISRSQQAKDDLRLQCSILNTTIAGGISAVNPGAGLAYGLASAVAGEFYD